MDNCSLHYSSQYWGDRDGPIVGWLLGGWYFKYWGYTSLFPLVWYWCCC